MTARPTVSVVVANLDGRALLPDCLDAVAALRYPPELVETIVVDNGSRDGSLELVAERWPGVRRIALGRNLGFAGANNAGARAARGAYLALLNNDARPDGDWLAALVGAVDEAGGTLCVGAKILDWQGETVDFVGGALNLYGRAFQLDDGLPLEATPYDRPHESLFACGGAMLIRRDLFLELGGFDDAFTAYFEDVDLGWRLWLAGYRVVFEPAAVTYHRKHGTGGRLFPVERRYALAEANALRMLVKNLEEANLRRVLPVALMLGVQRSLSQAGVDTDSYAFAPVSEPLEAGLAPDAVPEPAMTRVATSYLVAIDTVAREMPELLERREAVQAGRKRSDAEIFARFPLRPDNPIFPWRSVAVSQQTLAAAMDVPEALRPRPGRRLLIVTQEAVGPKMAGPGVRALELARAMAEHVEVTLAARGVPEADAPGVTLAGYDPDDPFYRDLDPYLAATDVVLAVGAMWSRVPRLRDIGKPAIVDLYDPFELEKLAHLPTIPPQHHDAIDLDSATELATALRVGDFFLCAGERQRDLWLGALLAAGRLNARTHAADPTLRALIDTVPFGVPQAPPRAGAPVLKGVVPGIAEGDAVILWNGGLWPWFDPDTALQALALVVRQRPNVRLYFAAGAHFDPEIVPDSGLAAHARETAHDLGLEDHVVFGSWIPYGERAGYLLEADVAVSTARDTLESRFAWRTRLLDCLWAGLPVVATAGEELADRIAASGLGSVVPPGDADRLAGALLAWLDAPDRRPALAERFAAAAADLAWPRQIGPLVRFMAAPAFAPDARHAAEALRRGVRIVEGYEARLANLEAELRAARGQLAGAEAAISEQRAYIERLEAHVEAIAAGRAMRLLHRLGLGTGRLE